jgi:hypothetical protein
VRQDTLDIFPGHQLGTLGEEYGGAGGHGLGEPIGRVGGLARQ